MRFVLRRLAHSVVVLFGVTIVVFALVHLVPGDPVRIALGTRFTPESYAALRHASGLDKPLLVQYLSYLGHAVRGDLGVSFRSGQPVTDLLLQRVPATLSLALAGLVIAVVMSVPLGMYAAVRSGRAADSVVRMISQVGVSVPDFWMATLLILLLTSVLGWLPPSGYVSLTDDPVGWLEHVAMPAVTVGLVAGSIMTRYVRSAVLEALGTDYTRTARSKGLPERVVLTRHVLRNALIPVLTVGGVQLATMLGGVIVVEVIFAWPGLGRLVYESVQARDYPVLQGAVLLVAALFLLINFVVDVLYAVIDPRISVS